MSNFSEIFEYSKPAIDSGVTIQQIEDATPSELATLLEIKPEDNQQFTDRIDLIKKKLIAYARKRNNIAMISQIQNSLTSDEWEWLESNVEFFYDSMVQQVEVPNG